MQRTTYFFSGGNERRRRLPAQMSTKATHAVHLWIARAQTVGQGVGQEGEESMNKIHTCEEVALSPLHTAFTQNFSTAERGYFYAST
jgi:hypothetical protein